MQRKYTLKDFFGNIFWAFKWVFSFSKWESLLLLLTRVIMTVSPIISSYIFAQILNQFGEALQGEILTFYDLLDEVYLWATLYAVYEVSETLIANLNYYLDSKLHVIYDTEIYSAVHRKISTLDFAKHEDGSFNDRIKKATENIDRVTSIYNQIIVSFSNMIAMFGSLGVLLAFHPLLTLILVLLSIPSAVLELKSTLERRQMYESLVQLNRAYWYAAGTLTTDRDLHEVRANNLGERIFQFINKIAVKKNAREFEYYGTLAKRKAWLSIFGIQGILSGLMIMQKIIETKGTIGDLSFYWGRATSLSNLIETTLGSLVFMYDRSKVLEYVKDIMEFENEIQSGDTKIDTNKPPKIEFKNVSFKYPKAKTYALKNLSFTINPYDEIAIIGLNGAGKTTLIKLLLRFYDATNGEILINDVPIKKVDLKTYYQSIGILFQDYNRYPYLTIEDSLKLNRTKFSKLGVNEALKFAEIEKDINKLPKGTKHKLSKWLDDGMNFSKGQEQKLALSRIFYRNAPMLILDEPTSSIDSDAEFRIFNKIYKHYKDKTIIVISHRFNTIKNAQCIFVLKNGQLIEKGSHKELMETKGQYYNSFNIQAQGYTETN